MLGKLSEGSVEIWLMLSALFTAVATSAQGRKSVEHSDNFLQIGPHWSDSCLFQAMADARDLANMLHIAPDLPGEDHNVSGMCRASMNQELS